MNTVRALVAVALLASSLAQAADGREDVMRVFREYESLNADFVYSVSAGTGRNGKPYSQLRREAEAYAEGPFTDALRKTQRLVCSSHDTELLAALLRVITETSNSASESPTAALVHIAKCQPSQLRSLASRIPEQQRTELARRAPELKAAFQPAAR